MSVTKGRRAQFYIIRKRYISKLLLAYYILNFDSLADGDGTFIQWVFTTFIVELMQNISLETLQPLNNNAPTLSENANVIR